MEYLPFRIAGLDFVVDASRVRAFQADACSHAVPIIDLRKKLDLPDVVYGRHPILVVLDLTSFVADYVSDVIEASPQDCRRGKLHAGGRVLDPDSLAGVV